MRNRQTINSVVEVSGRGVHTGQEGTVRFLPAQSGEGIIFRRTDLHGEAIPARLDYLVPDQLLRRTTLANGRAKVHTIEHVLSAAAGCDVDDLLIEMNTGEPPFLDGSAARFVELLQQAGITQQRENCQPLEIGEPLAFRDGDAEFSCLPSDEFRVSFFFTSDHPKLRRQAASIVITPETYAAEVAPARTFCFFEEIESMRRQGLIKGANLSSAVVIGRKGMLNDSLRFPDEPVRHKILDFIGDLALLGRPLKGHFLAWRSGHRANAAFALYLKKEFGL
ncbi:MAG: UDP-3-O-acyl-N-acetylglucosamine deacetylase [Candidatus Sumerlaeaceae bacterium]